MNMPPSAGAAPPNPMLNAPGKNAETIRKALLISVVALAVVEQRLSSGHESHQVILLSSLAWLGAGIGIFILGRRGRSLAFGIGILALLWLWLATQTMINGGLQTGDFMGYVALIVVAGFLLEEIGAAVALLIGTMTCLAFWNSGGKTPPWLAAPPDSFFESLHRAMGIVMACWVIGLVLWHLFRSRRTMIMNERRFSGLLESMPDCVVVANGRQETVFVNSRCREFFGYMPEELIGKPLGMLLPERCRPAYAGCMEKFLRQADGQSMATGMDLYGLRRDGSEFPMEIHLGSFEVDDGLLTIATIRDLTARKQAEEALRASEIRFRAIYEGSNDAIMLLSSRGFFDCNQRTLEIFGLKDRQEFLDLHPAQLSPLFQPDGQESFALAARHIEQAFREGHHRFEWMHLRSKKGRGPVARYGGQGINPRLAATPGEWMSPVAGIPGRLCWWLQPAARPGLAQTLYGGGFLLARTPADDENELGGVVFPVEVLLSAFDYGGERVLQATVRDIAERRQVEAERLRASQELEQRVRQRTQELEAVNAALRKSEGQYRTLTETSSDMVSMLEPDTGVFRYVSAASGSLLGYASEELLGRNVYEFFCPEDIKRIRKEHLGFRNSPGVHTTTCRMVRKDGSLVWCETKETMVNEEDGPGYVLAVSRDITERAETQEQLRLLSRAIESSPVSVIITDRVGTISYVNAKFCEVTGYTATELIGQNPRILKSGAQSRKFYQEMWAALGAGQQWQGEFCNKKKSGELYWEAQLISPVRDDLGRIKHFVAVREDITERKRTAAELVAAKEAAEAAKEVAEMAKEAAEVAKEDAEVAKEAAEAANRYKSVFLANMSHEIRTPLNAIIGFAQLLETDPALGRQQSEYVGIINRSGEFLLALINEILEMSKIEAGQVSVRPINFDLQTMLKSLVTMFKVRTDQKQLWLRLELNPTLPRLIYADEAKVRQILINLIGNAVKFTTKGGVVVRSRMYLAADHSWRLTVEVEDTGPGIVAADLEKIFEPFVQVKKAREMVGGTGLGLTISRSFSRLMGGDIGVLSREGQGSIFSLDIPLRSGGKDTSAVPPAVEEMVVGLPAGQPEQRILVADGNDPSRLLLVQMLAPVGFVVREANDGETAVKLAAAWKPPLILMDASIPGSAEAIRQIKSDSGAAGIVAVAVTANAFESDRRAILHSGFDDVLIKPFRREELFAKLGQHLGITYLRGQKPRQETPVAASSREKLTKKKLDKLPDELLRKMREAAAGGYLYQLYGLIDEAEKHEPAVAKGLRELADNYDYDSLVRLFGKG